MGEALLPGERRWRLSPNDPRGAGPPGTSCPFCGSDDLFYFAYTYSKEFAVACRRCGSKGPRRRTPRGARELWDARTNG